MAISGCITCIDMQAVFPAMAEEHVWFGSEPTDNPLLPAHPVAAAAECVEEPSFRRRIANRESARRSRERKQRHLDDLRDSAALLERENRALAARVEAASARLDLALLANAELRAEAAVMSSRLAAVSTPLLHSAACLTASTDMEQMIASLIADPRQELHPGTACVRADPSTLIMP